MFIFNSKVKPASVLIEDEQHKKIRYAFSKKDKHFCYTNITSWVKCRDFLNDAFFVQRVSEKIKESLNFTVYGFSYNTDPENVMDHIAIISQDYDDLSKIKQGIHRIMNPLEVSIYPTYTKTACFFSKETYTCLPVLIIQISPIWLTNTYTLSLFTLLLRLFTYPTQTINIWKNILTHQEETNDVYLIKNLETRKVLINKLLLNLNNSEMPETIDYKEIEDLHEESHYIHENLGILSGVYNQELKIYLNNHTGNTACPQDVKNVILF